MAIRPPPPSRSRRANGDDGARETARLASLEDLPLVCGLTAAGSENRKEETFVPRGRCADAPLILWLASLSVPPRPFQFLASLSVPRVPFS
jgi:hypothetical protein